MYWAQDLICGTDSSANAAKAQAFSELPFIAGAVKGAGQAADKGIKKLISSVLTRPEIIQRVDRVISPYVPRIKQLFPDAEVGMRGSLPRGLKGPHKGNAPFDPTDYDVDAFILSDQLAAKFSGRDWFRNAGVKSKEIRTMQIGINQELSNLPGMRTDKPFTFRVWTRAEFEGR